MHILHTKDSHDVDEERKEPSIVRHLDTPQAVHYLPRSTHKTVTLKIVTHKTVTHKTVTAVVRHLVMPQEVHYLSSEHKIVTAYIYIYIL
jgi:hypothetical protein